MILTHMIDTNENIKLTQGQGHRVKGQGQFLKLCKNIGSSIKHERKIRSK